MSDTVSVTLELTLKPEAVEDFCAQITEALEATRTFPGFVDITIRHHADDPTRVIFIEEWETRSAYEAYTAFRTESGMLAAMAEILTVPPRLDIWDKLIA